MKLSKVLFALVAVSGMSACSSTQQPVSVSDVSNYSGEFASHRSYALNLMEAAELGGAKDVKLKEGDSVIDLAGSNATFGFVDSIANGGSLLTAGLTGLAGGLLTPDSDAKFNQAIALVDISELSSNEDADAFAKREMLNKFGKLLVSTTNSSDATFKTNTWSKNSDDHWNVTDVNGKFGKVYTDNSTHEVCQQLLNEKMNEMVAYNDDYDKSRNVDWQLERFGKACGVRLSRLKTGSVVTNAKLPWLESGKKYMVVTAMFGTSVSLNKLSKTDIPVDGLYLYYTSNGANVGKAKDTPYPYIQAPHGKEMFFIKP